MNDFDVIIAMSPAQTIPGLIRSVLEACLVS